MLELSRCQVCQVKATEGEFINGGHTVALANYRDQSCSEHECYVYKNTKWSTDDTVLRFVILHIRKCQLKCVKV